MQPDDLFCDLIPCDSYHFPFVDRHAWFGVTFDQGRALGPGMLQLRSTAFTAQPADALLPLWVEEDGQWMPVARRKMGHLPWCVREEGVIGGIVVTGSHAYLDERRILCSFTFRNGGSDGQTVHPAWCGLLTGDRFLRNPQQEAQFGVEDVPRRTVWAAVGGGQVTGGLRDATGQLPQPSLRIHLPPGVAASLHRGPSWSPARAESAIAGQDLDAIHYRLDVQACTLAPGEERSFTFVAEVSVTTHRAAGEPWIGAGTVDAEAAIAASRERFLARIDWAHPPRCTTPALMERTWRARWALERTGFQANGAAGEFGSSSASTCVPSNSGFTRVFFWDSLFTAVALSDFDADFARGAIRAVFARQDPASGLCPEHSFNFHVPGRCVIGAPQMPVASWAVARHLRRHPDDDAFLAELYPHLGVNHRYWLRRDADGDGLAELTWSGQCADNSPEWEPYFMDAKRGCTWLPPVAAVQLNAFLYRDALELAALAARMGKHEEAREWRFSAEKRGDDLLRVCYVPAERRFWDYDHATRRHRRTRTSCMMWPVWAGMPMPAEARRELIDDVLLDPRQFFGDIPFPTVAYDDRHFDPGGYWRGRAWPHISYWLIEMLVREGRHAAAAEAARRTLAAMSRDPAFPENLNGSGDRYEFGSSPDYNWGCAAAYLLATGAWRDAGWA